jgi:succinate-semialdehyde dehydrogenase/glutarate-semialdehyde dehydrogenase
MSLSVKVEELLGLVARLTDINEVYGGGESSEPIQVRNPRTGLTDYEFTPFPARELTQLTIATRQRQRKWAQMTLSQRGSVLKRWAEVLEKCREEMVKALADDLGRHFLADYEVRSVIALLHNWAARSSSLQLEESDRSSTAPSVEYSVRTVPYQVVGVISPWNFPLLLSMVDSIPALLAGCGVIVKVSSLTPRFVDVLTASISRTPELSGLVSIIRGGGPLGFDLIRNVDAVCFTGSTEVGRLVAIEAARNLIPTFLELGGNDPAVVLENADLSTAVPAILRASLVATGQACQSIERVYVHSSLYGQFVAEMVKEAEKVELSFPDPHQGILGPIISQEQAKVIAGQVEQAVAKGARVLTGGEILNLGGGLWMKPTVIVNVDHTMDVMTQESFGPLIPIMSFRTQDEAIAYANLSEFGLSAAVFGADTEVDTQVAMQIEAGGISINDAGLTTQVFDAEKQSFKKSGLGASRMGTAALARFLRKKALYQQHGSPLSLEDFSETRFSNPQL